MRPTGAHNPKASNKTSVKEQIRCIRAIRVSLNACGRRIAMSIRKLKHKTPINAQEPTGSFAHAQK